LAEAGFKRSDQRKVDFPQRNFLELHF
jgi:hypothetical protein